MTGPELQAALEALYGPTWRTDFTAETGMHRSTLHRQVTKLDDIDPVLAWGVKQAQGLETYRRYRNTSQNNYRRRKRAETEEGDTP